jgi:hypothetical protein
MAGMVRATKAIIRRRWLALMGGLGMVAALAALATPPALSCDDPPALGVEAAAAVPATPAPRAPRAPRAATSPESPSPEGTPAPPATPESPDAELELPEAPTRILPRGWFGFAFLCEECSAKSGKTDSAAVWQFSSWPKVYSVDLGSPAARGGLRRGDVITHIDGVSIVTPEGGRRFGAIRPGQAVRWGVVRAGAARSVVARAAERPERRERVALSELRGELSRLNEMSDLDQLRRELANLNQRIERVKLQSAERVRLQDVQRARKVEQPVRRLRYAGVINGTEVEVRGPGSVIVSESDAKNELVINTGDAVVVIRVPEGLLKGTAGKKKN